MALPKRYARLVGSKFTSTASFLGWRHFHVGALRRSEGGWDAEVISSVEPQTRAWVDVAALFDRRQWHAGWRLLEDLLADGARSSSPSADAQAPGDRDPRTG